MAYLECLPRSLYGSRKGARATGDLESGLIGAFAPRDSALDASLCARVVR